MKKKPISNVYINGRRDYYTNKSKRCKKTEVEKKEESNENIIEEEVDSQHEEKKKVKVPKGGFTIDDEKIIKKKDIIKKKERKPKEKVPKNEKYIFNYVNSEGQLVGTFYNTQALLAAKKIAKRIYRDTGKKFFEFKVYNRIKDKFATYLARVVECEKYKKIGSVYIPINLEIKIVRA